MKNLTYLLLAFSLIFVACEGDPGPMGPPGFDGLDGLDGGLIVAESFERTIDFLPSNNYEEYITIPANMELLPTDMILTYILWEQDPGTGNDVWRLIPQTVYTDSGEQFQYNYDYSFDEVRLFIHAPVTFNFGNLSAGATLNQTFRMIILPVDFVNSNTIDITNYNEVMDYLQ